MPFTFFTRCKYFNPRSHERSDFGSSTSTSMNTISIHAPTRGATYNGSVANGLSGISIHAPTRGATWWGVVCTSTINISIHAPTRGATCNSIRPLCIYEFQSTLPREERLHAIHFFHALQIFQSTLPREERPLSGVFIKSVINFNPRSHERSDGVAPATIGDLENFNPRSHERSDIVCGVFNFMTSEISIHAPTRGATNDVTGYQETP